MSVVSELRPSVRGLLGLRGLLIGFWPLRQLAWDQNGLASLLAYALSARTRRASADAGALRAEGMLALSQV